MDSKADQNNSRVRYTFGYFPIGAPPASPRVDRLLGEPGIPKDSPAGREQWERYLETRRAPEDETDYKPIRRGWCLGAEAFRKELLASVNATDEEPFRAKARRETTEERARRISNEELDKLGWAESELAGWAKGDARKNRIARRL